MGVAARAAKGWRTTAVDHQTRDEFWDEHTVLPLLDQVEIPVYVGCDWDNVPMRLPGRFTTWKALEHNLDVRMCLTPPRGTTWPWESMHLEALEWFDHHLKDRNTGITDVPPHSLLAPGGRGMADLGRLASSADYEEPRLGADGAFRAAHQRLPRAAVPGHRSGPSPRARKSDPPFVLYWQSTPLEADLDIVGPIELQLSATSTAIDTAWIVMLSDVAPDGRVTLAEPFEVCIGESKALVELDDPDSGIWRRRAAAGRAPATRARGWRRQAPGERYLVKEVLWGAKSGALMQASNNQTATRSSWFIGGMPRICSIVFATFNWM